MIEYPCSLYKVNSKGKTLIWTIDIDYFEKAIIVKHGQLSGVKQSNCEYIYEGKQNRDIDDQLELRANSKIQDKIKNGYHYTMNDAQNNKGMLTSGYIRPMLAQKYTRTQIIEKFAVQYKYDGNRCLIHKKDGEFIAYSRNGKDIKTIDHIFQQMQGVPDGSILDGELYIHGMKLQNIRSLVSKKQEQNHKLDFVCYDIVSDEKFSKRFEMLKEIEETISSSIGGKFKIATTFFDEDFHNSDEKLFMKLSNAIENGYEGLIIRQDSSGYEPGKRSSSLLKLKQFHDQEFTVIGIELSKDGHGILVCRIDDHSVFKVLAPGTHEEKLHVGNNHDEYIGKKVTVQYSMLTNDSIPFHPVAKSFRGKQ